METVLLIVALLLMAVGVLGTVVPLLPGTTLIWAAALAHRWLAGPEAGASWLLLGWITLLWLVSLLVDFASGALGAKKFGASRQGVAGGVIGSVVGIFFGLPGIFLGPLAGALIGEALALRAPAAAVRAGFGTFVGTALGIAGRLVLGLLMAGSFAAGVTVFRW